MGTGVCRIGSNRVVRGGSWINNGRNVRSAYRNNNSPDNRNNNIGFRLALAHAPGSSRVVDQINILSAIPVAWWRKTSGLRYVSSAAVAERKLAGASFHSIV